MGQDGIDPEDPDRGAPAADMPPEAGGTAALDPALRVSLHVCALVLGSAALYFGKEFFLPIALGILGALTLIPIVRWLDRRGIPTALSAIAIVLALGVALGAGAWLASGPVADWITRAPTLGHVIERKLASLRGSVDSLAEASKTVEDLSRSAKDPSVQEVVVKEPGFLSSATTTLWTATTRLGIALFLVLFLLASGDMVYEKIIRVLPRLSDKKTALRIVHDVERSISRYLLTITLINCGLGVAIACMLWALGMPSPALWGLAGTVLNFLPYLGALTGIVLTGIVAFVSMDTVGHALMVPAGYLILTTIEGNVVTPLILGRRLELNTVALFVGVTFWGWVWGLAGVLIAVPLMVVLKTLGDHLPAWATFGEFLSMTPPKSEAEAEAPNLNPVAKA
ncbi:AI-2E family transporter [Prosthecomicrobium sp. N25]|uniref:AI-2E family transporter n=1 Tax=Prosthecomicrobium sp. N25 TaxID=3129254 RepID=UPI003077A74E